MEKFIYEGQVYYFNNGICYDEDYIKTPLNVSLSVSNAYYKTIDFNLLTEDEFIKTIISLKQAELYNLCIEKAFLGFERFKGSVRFYSMVYPQITSSLRKVGRPQEAISLWRENKDLMRNHLSPFLLSSLAGAYCDVKDYKHAKACIDYAYTLQGGATGHMNEISLVYERIKKEAPEYFDY